MKRLSTLALATLFTLAFGALRAEKPDAPREGDKPRHSPADAFKKLDGDADGKISLKEFLASPRAQKDPAKAEGYFKKRDKDGDGSLTLEEFSAGGPPKGDRPEKKKKDE
jgi:hypothetical protein